MVHPAFCLFARGSRADDQQPASVTTKPKPAGIPGEKMTSDLSDYSSESLLKMFMDEENPDEDLSYRAGEKLLQRWRKGNDLEFLIALLESEKTADRLSGAFILREIGGPVEDLREPVIRLAEDPLFSCRCAFVYFMLDSDFYDETIALGLVKCLADFNLVVRTYVMRWAVHTSDERFDHFSRLVESGAGASEHDFSRPADNDFWRESERRRALRGLSIMRRLRAEETIEDIKGHMSEEDNYVLDSLQFSEHLLKQYVARRKAD